jgi:uncharacterized protein
VLDVHELGRRPGAMRRVSHSLPAPADLTLGGVVGVPEGTGLVLTARLESVLDGVLVSGTVTAAFVGECVRCLDPVHGEIAAEFQELYVYPDRLVDDAADMDTIDEELVVEGDLIDLEQPFRDAVVLALPHTPLCRDDCPGLCVQCGARLADDPGHRHDSTDPRWAALTGLLSAGEQHNEAGSPRAGVTEEN